MGFYIAVAGITIVVVIVLTVAHWRRTKVLVIVDGNSMLPTYRDGDRLLVKRDRTAHVREGQVIALAPEHVDEDGRVVPAHEVGDGSMWFIKRVAAAPGDRVPTHIDALSSQEGEVVPDGCLVILGDNASESYDSRQEGFIDAQRLRGVVIRNLDA
ncbi:MAG TPA: hypothetical protein H9902_06710 [Candidatus Stackebrandtia faecavium]|nr:hypothetical protein [Candidatus Stackebrandtia faecavium]